MCWGVIFDRGQRYVIKNNRVGFAYRWWLAEQRTLIGVNDPSDRTLRNKVRCNDVDDYVLMHKISQREKSYSKFFKDGCRDLAIELSIQMAIIEVQIAVDFRYKEWFKTLNA